MRIADLLSQCINNTGVRELEVQEHYTFFCVVSLAFEDLSNDCHCFLSDSFRNQEIKNEHILFLEDSPAADPGAWLRIAWQLKRLDKPGCNDAFTETKLKEISKLKNDNDRDCLREMILRWQNMSSQHLLGLLCDALKEADLGRTVEKLVARFS